VAYESNLGKSGVQNARLHTLKFVGIIMDTSGKIYGNRGVAVD